MNKAKNGESLGTAALQLIVQNQSFLGECEKIFESNGLPNLAAQWAELRSDANIQLNQPDKPHEPVTPERLSDLCKSYLMLPTDEIQNRFYKIFSPFLRPAPVLQTSASNAALKS